MAIKECECIVHRYGICHTLPDDNEVYSHSQSSWDAFLRGRQDVRNIPSSLYEHGMKARDLEEKYYRYCVKRDDAWLEDKWDAIRKGES